MHGRDIVTNLYSQSEVLKKVKQRTMQMLNTIGMSESILKLIDKRTKADVFIFIALAIITLLIIYVLYYYIKPLLWWIKSLIIYSFLLRCVLCICHYMLPRTLIEIPSYIEYIHDTYLFLSLFLFFI